MAYERVIAVDESTRVVLKCLYRFSVQPELKFRVFS
jgi:hypothetical protein